MAHQRGDLGDRVALVQMDSAGIDHHGDALERTNGDLEGVAAYRAGAQGEAGDVFVGDSADRGDCLGQRAQTRAQTQGDGMLHSGVARLDSVLINHAKSLLSQQVGRNARAGAKRSCEASIINVRSAAAGTFGLEHAQCRSRAASGIERCLGPGLKSVGDVVAGGQHHPIASDLRRRSGAGKPAQGLRTDGAHLHTRRLTQVLHRPRSLAPPS